MRQYQLRPGYVLRNIAGDYLAIPVTISGACRRRMILLNSVGAFIWELLSEKCTIPCIADKITEEFDTNYEAAKTDTEEFIMQLETEQLI